MGNNNKPVLYALLIGINDYEETISFGDQKATFPKLEGCVADVHKIKDYLSAESAFTPAIEILTDKKATKKEIVQQFTNHLGKAGENDSILIYFSGHGTQELTSKTIFRSESDEKLEAIACYYDESLKDDFLLADKELRWLIYKASLNCPNIVTIFDCCHSGDVVRDIQRLRQNFAGVVEKRIKFIFPQRSWEQFIFHDAIPEESFLQAPDVALLPEGKHFQFSACESNESAIEVMGEGVFTKVLLEVLNNAGGDVTYNSLGSRIRQYMRNVYEQTPKVYFSNIDASEGYRSFLNKPLSTAQKAFGEIVYNENDGWLLNMGAIQGIDKNMPPVTIFDSNDPSHVVMAVVEEVNADSAVVSIKEGIDISKAHRAQVEGLAGETLRLHFATGGADLQQQKKLFESLVKAGSIVEENEEERSQYVLRYLNNKYYLTFPGDLYRPIIKPVAANDAVAPEKILSNLKHIASWERLKNLRNRDADTLLPDRSVKVDVNIGPGILYENVNDNTEIPIEFKMKNGKWSNALSVRLTNVSKKKLYCCVLYLMSGFASYSRYLNPPVEMLEPGKYTELQLRGDTLIKMGLDPVMKWYNWPHQKDYLQCIISTENFDASLLDFKQLAPPSIPVKDMHPDNEFAKETTVFDNDSGWFTKRIVLVLKNPEYNKLTEAEKELMRNAAATADFAKGLYAA